MDVADTEVIEEIIPRKGDRTIHAVKREKSCFDFPLHTHEEFEINLLVECEGAMRIVGDSVMEIDNMDLVLVGPNLKHGWLQHKCMSRRIKEITIQFPVGFFNEDYLRMNNLDSLLKLIENSSRGIAFDYETILENYALMRKLTVQSEPFEMTMILTRLVYNLSKAENCTLLASESYSGCMSDMPSRRITKVQQYINRHYQERISLGELAEIAGMSVPSFSKFFKQSTSRTVGQFILDVRMGIASRLLVKTLKSISEICYECGFNNVSHFCRAFRSYKGYTPGEFRQLYLK